MNAHGPFDALSHKFLLAQWITERGCQRVVEVGVKQGRTFRHVLSACPTLKNYTGIDTWPTEARDHWRAALDTDILDKWPGRAFTLQGDSAEWATQFPDYSLDLVFIDADHAEKAVRKDILAWRRKLKPGGLLCGHDIHMESVRRAVDDLCPGWQHHPQECWALEVYPILIAAVPYADDRNLGRAYNEFFRLLPDDGWGCALDHDATFTTPEWHRQMTAAIVQEPFGVFTVQTIRTKAKHLIPDAIVEDTNDLAYHRQFGKRLAEQGSTLRDVTDEREPNGVCFLLSKAAWREAGGFADGLHYVDRMMWLALKWQGRRIYCIDGLYLYHWHRADGAPFQAGAWATEHRVSKKRVIRLAHPERLPTYDGSTT